MGMKPSAWKGVWIATSFLRRRTVGDSGHAGMDCCDAWERWKNWNGDQNRVAALRCVTDHPAAESSERFVWLNGSDIRRLRR